MPDGRGRESPARPPRPRHEESAELLDLLARGRGVEIWPVFVQRYSQVVMQVVRLFARDEDQVSGCFLYCCRRLNQRSCRRLRRFDPSGPATFTTWLHAVVYNLCRDWRRAESPRRHAFRWISDLPTFEQEVFRLYFERRMSARELIESMRQLFPAASAARVNDAIERLSARLSPRQLWLLQSRRPRVEALPEPDESVRWSLREVASARPDPEAAASRREEAALLNRALESLPAPDRLLLRLRFEQEASLRRIAELLELRNAQAADRRIRQVLRRLREQMSGAGSGKAGAMGRVIRIGGESDQP